MFSTDDHGFDTILIGNMVKKKYTVNGIEYDPTKIFEHSRLDELKERWKKELEKLVVEELSEPDKVCFKITIVQLQI